MIKKIFLQIILVSAIASAQAAVSDISSMPGAFTRMGFGARGMGMGNAMSAVTEGSLVSYYNPALASFQQGNSFQTSYSILSLDRSLNFLNFTRNFEFGQKTDADGNIKPRSVAGISAGIINAGVSKIDARDNQGNKTGELSTTENQFFVAVANRFSDKLSIGLAFKFFYYKLYENVTSTGLGFDIGALYLLNDNITVSLMMSDINSKYEWDTGKIYGSRGNISKDKFPLLKKVGLSYKFKEPRIIAAVEFENSDGGTNILRAGGEYNIYENLFFRAGLDKLNLSNFDFPARPSFGFSYFRMAGAFNIGINYAFVIEPYSYGDQHIIGINVTF
ncbi:MAG: hypothetical protein CVV24_13890 [Ignavibacteriae bacterium HGW-Ignavibacteriae-3]|nr:MAG: hypothetical protein CVV24_13890 [Ignavibacteriae bacterium HGW-Ignavibacteriae-3]